jgi:hypothetical protein
MRNADRAEQLKQSSGTSAKRALKNVLIKNGVVGTNRNNAACGRASSSAVVSDDGERLVEVGDKVFDVF